MVATLFLRPGASVLGEWIHGLSGPFSLVLTQARAALRVVSSHTGLPIVLVAAFALVLSYRLARRMTRLAAELTLVVTALFVATRFGWISW